MGQYISWSFLVGLSWSLLPFLLSLTSVTCIIGDTSGFDPGNDNCRRPGLKIGNETTCYELKHNYCFGTKLPYTWSTSELVNPNWTEQQLQNDLFRWEGLKNSPKCWTVIQPLLCAVYMPKCQDGLIELPSQELCKVTRSPCKLVEQVMNDWPDFLKCDDPIRYPPNCKNTEIRELRFNTTSLCKDPMIPVEDSFSYYEGFEGCGLKCRGPIFTDEQHAYMAHLIFWQSVCLFLATGFVIIAYIMDWNSARRLPSVIIFYAVVCYFIANLGWMLQFLTSVKQDIVCRNDGTIRRNEHRAGENVLCTLVFILINFGSFAALGWITVFAYVWNLTFSAVGRIKELVDNKVPFFHVFVWTVSGGLTIIHLTFGKIDGNSLSGVCFVGYTNTRHWIFGVLMPISMLFVPMLVNFTRGVCRLINVALSSPAIIGSGRTHLRSMITRALLFIFGATVIFLTFLGMEIYNISMQPTWSQSLRKSLICQMNLSDVADCEMTDRPIFWVVGVNISLFFAGGLLISSWALTGSSIQAWKRGLSRLICSGSNEDRHSRYHQPAQKHLLMAQAYEKRGELSQNGHLSLNLISIHGDPTNLNRILLDPNQLYQANSNSKMNQTNGEDVSSEWVAALPHMILRRNALFFPNSPNNSISCASEDNSRPASEIGIRLASNSDLNETQPKKRSRLRKLKDKLGPRDRNGRCRSISSFESSEMGVRYYQSSNSDLDKHDSKPRSGISKIKDMLGSHSGFGWRRRGSISSLESIRKRIDPRLYGGKLEVEVYKRTKEFSVQTSFENLPMLKTHNAVVARNLDMIDKSMQTSTECLRRTEVATQTKKSATKKHNKRKQAMTDPKEHTECVEADEPTPDPVLQLLTPG